MDPQQATDVAPEAARLAPKARARAGVEDRQLRVVEDLAGVQAREHDLGGACEEQVVLGDVVDVLAPGGEVAGAEQGLLADEVGDGDQREPVALQAIPRQLVQRELETHRVALEREVAAARDLGHPLELGPPLRFEDLHVVAQGKRERAGRADLPLHHVAAVVGSDRDVIGGRLWHPEQHRLEPSLRVCEQRRDRVDARPEGVGRLAQGRVALLGGVAELPAERVLLGLQALLLGLERGDLGVEREQRVEIELHPLLGDGLADGVGVLADRGEREHGVLPRAG